MILRYLPYTLALRHRFTIAGSSRMTTPVMLVEVEDGGIIGFGEASMPPYLGESHETARKFLARVRLPPEVTPSSLAEVLREIDAIGPGNTAAKAAVDIALHDWIGKRMGQPLHRIWDLDPSRAPLTSYTIPIGDGATLAHSIREAEEFPILKIKLGGADDKEAIRIIRSETGKPLRVDVNQGWKTREEALGMIEYLADQGVEFVEQPLRKDRLDDAAWLRERSPLPIIADESVGRCADVEKAIGAFDGVNIKLMKSTGLSEARAMFVLARKLGLKTMIGCMTETSCAISAASQLSPMADWADLDGALLIANDPFRGAEVAAGTIRVPAAPGIGAVRVQDDGFAFRTA